MFPIFCSSNTLFPHASVVGENTQQRLGWHIAGTPTGAKDSINEAIAAVIESGGRTATQVAVNIANATNSSLQVSEQVESNLKLINDVYL
ncbi:MAG: hypothetical protein JNK66_09890, partial [Chitinophagales bacterium]|nr:hypothetical protein [Chitinophagales bacterium]